LLLAPAPVPGPRGGGGGAPQGRDLPRDRRGEAGAGGLLHRGPAAGAAVSAVPRGHARGGGALVLRRDRLPRAGGGGRPAAGRPGGDGRGPPPPRGEPALPPPGTS